MANLISVADADALIALSLEKDLNHNRAVKITTQLLKRDVTVVFPFTVFPEAITSLQRAADQPEKAKLISQQLEQGIFHIIYLDETIILQACQIFKKAVSKQNTFFDAIVAATTSHIGAQSIFSFDQWYTKLGYQLAG